MSTPPPLPPEPPRVTRMRVDAMLPILPRPQTTPVDVRRTRSADFALVPTPISSGASVERNLVDSSLENLWSLPDVVSKVAVQQRSHSKEISAQKEILKRTQEQVREEKERLDDLSDEIQAVHRKVISSQSVRAEKKKSLQSLQNDIAKLIEGNTVQECEYEQRKRELEQFQETVSTYNEKMAKYSADVEVVQSEQTEYKQREQLKAEIEELKVKKATGVTDVDKEPLRQSIEEAQQDLNGLNQGIQNKKQQVAEKTKQLKNTQKETSVLHKRNAAQLTRLKRQLKEMQLRQRQWSDEASQLEACISQLKQ